MDISNINGINKVQPAQKAEKSRKTERTEETRSGDRVEISPAAQKAADIARATEVVKSVPDVRIDRVQAAAERIASGNYLTEKVAEAIAEKIASAIVGGGR